MKVTDAKAILRVFEGETPPGGINTYHRITDAYGSLSVMVREKIVWAMGEKLFQGIPCALPSFDAKLRATNEEMEAFADMFYEAYVFDAANAFFSCLEKAFEPFGVMGLDYVQLSEVFDAEEYCVAEDYDEKLHAMCDEEVALEMFGDVNVAYAIPDFIEMLRASVEFDPGREYSDPYAFLMKSARIGRFLSSGTGDLRGKRRKEFQILMRAVAEPIDSDFFCNAGVFDGIWYCGTLVGALDEYSTVTFDAVNPWIYASLVALDDFIGKTKRRRRRKKRKGRRAAIRRRRHR